MKSVIGEGGVLRNWCERLDCGFRPGEGEGGG